MSEAQKLLGKQLQHISTLGVRVADSSRGQFKNRICGEAERHPPWAHIASEFLHPILAIQIDQVDRELHTEGVDCFTRDNPETFSGGKMSAPEQPLPARCSLVGHLHRTSQECLAVRVVDFKAEIWLHFAAIDGSAQKVEGRVTAFAFLWRHASASASALSGNSITAAPICENTR
jgi:hypothetical protein